MHPFRHLATIIKHRHAVFRHARRTGITWQGLTHDLSKFSPTEFWQGARHYQGNRSPNEGEREKAGYSVAWMHHKGRNRHHYEWWVDIDPVTKIYTPVKMPMNFLAEMFCDRVAASKIYRGKAYQNDDPLKYFERGNARNLMHPETAETLHKWLKILAEEGEDRAFWVVKLHVKVAKIAKRDRKKQDKEKRKQDKQKKKQNKKAQKKAKKL